MHTYMHTHMRMHMHTQVPALRAPRLLFLDSDAFIAEHHLSVEALLTQVLCRAVHRPMHGSFRWDVYLHSRQHTGSDYRC